MSLRLLVILASGLELLAGVLILLGPNLFVALLFAGHAEPMTIVLARLLGAGVFSLGLAGLRARDDLAGPAGRGLTYGLTCYNILAAVLLTWAATGLGLGAVLLWMAALLHAGLSILLGYALGRGLGQDSDKARAD